MLKRKMLEILVECIPWSMYIRDSILLYTRDVCFLKIKIYMYIILIIFKNNK